MSVFELQPSRRDLDPQVAQISKRITTLRRQMGKTIELEDKVKEIIQRY